MRAFLKRWWKNNGLEATVCSTVILGLCSLVVLGKLMPVPVPHGPYAVPRAAVHQLFDKGREASGCSGVMIAPKTMLTAAHCIQSGKPWGAGVARAAVKVIAQDRDRDIALLEVGLPCPCVPVAAKDAAVDEAVVVVGYPLNDLVQTQIATEGRAQGRVEDKYLKGPRLRLSAPVAQGNSGGGVFVQRSGEWALVGITTNVTLSSMGFSTAPISHLSSAATLDSIEAILAPALAAVAH
jgi:S1-C subfamily serine protease